MKRNIIASYKLPELHQSINFVENISSRDNKFYTIETLWDNKRSSISVSYQSLTEGFKNYRAMCSIRKAYTDVM